MVGKSFWLVLLIIVASPFYGRAALDPKPLLVLIVAVLLLKAISNYGSWQELRMEGQRARVLYRLLRYVAIIGLLAALLWLPLGLALITLLIGAAVYVVCLRLPGKVAVPWERLIAAEKNHAAAVMRMLGWFVDVPSGERKVNHRRWLSFIGRKLPWQQEQAFRFLLVRTFIRTELLPTLSRFVVFGVILVLLARESWFGIAVYLLFIILAGMQMTMLRKQHTDTLWLSIYPLPPAARRLETIRLITLVQLVVAVVLWLPFVLTGDLVRLVGTLIVGLLIVWLQRASLNRKWLRELQLEEQFE